MKLNSVDSSHRLINHLVQSLFFIFKFFQLDILDYNVKQKVIVFKNAIILKLFINIFNLKV